MKRRTWLTILSTLLCCLCCPAVGDDEQILTAARKYFSDIAKPHRNFEQARSNARDVAIKRLASQRKKDAVQDNLWKCVLAIDSSNVDALLYFKGNPEDPELLKKVMRDLPQLGDPLPAPVGNWIVDYHHQGAGRVSSKFTIDNQGRYSRDGSPPVAIDLKSDHVILHFGNSIDRWTPAGGRYLVEHWYPNTNYPAEHPTGYGVAVRQPPK